MKRLARWAAQLYPSAWRERYGEEFEALLEDAAVGGDDVWDVLKGACIMRLTRTNMMTIAAAFALAGAVIAGVWSMAPVSGYISAGTLRVQTSGEPGDPAQVALRQAVQLAVSRASLSELMQRPSLNLYQLERTNTPLEDVIQKMRRDITIRNEGLQGGRLTLSVAFRYRDAAAAQRTTSALIERVRSEVAGKAAVQVTEAAGPAQALLAGKRWKMVGTGMLSGLALGMVFGALWNTVNNRKRWSLRRIGGFAAAGSVAGLTVAMLLPDVFISTAVLRTSGPMDPAALQRTVLSDETLSNIIRREALYPSEAQKLPLADVARQMRDRFIKVQEAGKTSLDVHAYVVSFQDHDRAKAQAVTRDLIAAWLETGLSTGVSTEVLDPASLPGAPISPNRLTIVLFGACAGVLLGLAASRFGPALSPA